jgi:3-hydroxyisobutyrate dehydrogenase
MAAGLAAVGVAMLDAPVFGSTGPAAEGTLGIMVGGDRAVFDAQRPLLATMGKAIYYMGAQGMGALAKLCVNLLIGAQVHSLGEALAMGRRGGLDLRALVEVFGATNAASPLIKRKAETILAGDFQAARIWG